MITWSAGLGEDIGVKFRDQTKRKEMKMPNEKRNNLAIYTLAASILLSSIIVSMNQSNAHTTDTTNISRLRSCVNSNWTSLNFAIMDLERGSHAFYVPRNC